MLLDRRLLRAHPLYRALGVQQMSENEESKKESPLRAAMTVILKANDVVVAQVDDPVLWNDVFAAISGGQPRLPLPTALPPVAAVLPAANQAAAAVVANTPAMDPLSKFAKEL